MKSTLLVTIVNDHPSQILVKTKEKEFLLIDTIYDKILTLKGKKILGTRLIVESKGNSVIYTVL